MQMLRADCAGQWRGCILPRRLVALAAGLSGILFSYAALAEVDVATIGGGPPNDAPIGTKPYGFANGNTFSVSQFNGPFSIALDSTNNLYLADKTNCAVRLITQVGDTANSQTTTYLTFGAGHQPVGVAVDGADNLYVLTQGENKLHKYNKYQNSIFTNALPGVPTALTLAFDADTNIFVALSNGRIIRVTQSGATNQVTSGFGQIKGIAAMPNGLLAVSDAVSNAIFMVNTNTGVKTLLAGDSSSASGFVDGVMPNVRFNQPHGLAATSDGRLVVADRMNHRVRLVETNGTTTTIYGVDPTNWDSGYFPGWSDGPSTGANAAAAREPVSAAISPGGLLFTTEMYWHLLREITGAGLTAATAGGGSTNVLAPTFVPECGYYPDCQTIYVTGFGGTVYYTTDGTEPTTNNFFVPMTNDFGSFQWCVPQRDLTALKMKSFVGTNASPTVSGQNCGTNTMGFTREYTNAPGSTALIPVVIDLRSSDVMRSIQFRVEVTPNDTNTPAISERFQGLALTSNDFVQVTSPSLPAVSAVMTISTNYLLTNNARGLLVSALGTNSNFFVKNSAVALLLKVPIPTNAIEGQTYNLNVLYPSATSDGSQTPLSITNKPSRTLHIGFKEYLVGDSSPGNWYNAGDFGNGDLLNNDVNNALYASVGIGTPYSFSDVFDAMDAYPSDGPGVLGGDGAIRFLDWEILLQRSTHFDPNNWARAWSDNAVRTNRYVGSIPLPQTASSPTRASKTAMPPGTVWMRHAVVGALPVANLFPGSSYFIPVYVKVLPGYSLSGLQFRAILLPQNNAPDPGQIQFIAASGSPAPSHLLGGLSPNDLVCGWALGTFNPALQNSNLLGYIHFQAPASVQTGHSYVLRFTKPDGAPNNYTQYDLESLPGTVSGALQPAEIISDEWKVQFFGSVTSPLAADNADPDGDGVPNWKEYLAGTDPTNPTSCLQFISPVSVANGAHGLTLRWLTAPGKTYVLESNLDLHGTNWTTITTFAGDGYVKQFTDTNSTSQLQFYRLRVLSP